MTLPVLYASSAGYQGDATALYRDARRRDFQQTEMAYLAQPKSEAA